MTSPRLVFRNGKLSIPTRAPTRATIMMLLGGVDGGAMDNPPSQPFPLFI